MNDSNFFIFIAIIFLVIFLLKFFFSKKARIKRRLKNAVQKKISDFKNGETAKFTGNIEFVDQPLIAPLSNRECSYYYVHIEQKVSSGKNSYWKTIIEEEISNKFVIRDGEKCAFINDSKLKSYIIQDKEYSSGFLNDANAILEKYLNKHGYESEGFLGLNKAIRYKEGILEKGEKIAVLGKGEWKDADQIDLPGHYEKVLVINSTEKDHIYLSDDPDTTKIKTVNNNKTAKSNTKNYRRVSP
ncbi:MAG: hypothetical protein ABFR62_02565 [Bacteroidota bacterium]